MLSWGWIVKGVKRFTVRIVAVGRGANINSHSVKE